MTKTPQTLLFMIVVVCCCLFFLFVFSCEMDMVQFGVLGVTCLFSGGSQAKHGQ